MNLIDEGIVFTGDIGTSTQICCFPSIVSLADSSLLCTFVVGSAKNSADSVLMLTRSMNGGRTWNKPLKLFSNVFQGIKGSPQAGYITEVSAGHLLICLLWTDFSDPTLPLFNPETGGLLPARILLAKSDDNGYSWSELRQIDNGQFYMPNSWLNQLQPPITGPILCLPGGILACQFETHKHYDDSSPLNNFAVLNFSDDNGYSWGSHAIVAHDPDGRFMYWDQRPVVLENNCILTLFWTHDSHMKKDINIHQSISHDGGKTWSLPEDTGISGQVATPIALSNNCLIMGYVKRYVSPSIRVRRSTDNGKTWDADSELTIYAKTEIEKNKSQKGKDMASYLQEINIWTFGLPRGVSLTNNEALIIYYAGSMQQTSIHWARINV